MGLDKDSRSRDSAIVEQIHDQQEEQTTLINKYHLEIVQRLTRMETKIGR